MDSILASLGLNSQPSDAPPTTEPDMPPPIGPERMCWICQDTDKPAWETLSPLDRLRHKKPRKIYFNPECGYLISPCLCKGSIQWVHEKCLQEWRYSNLASENRWRCGRCGFRYQFERIAWAQRVRSPVLGFAMAVSILLMAVFLLGFVADPIINLWVDPWETLAETVGIVEVERDEGAGWFGGGGDAMAKYRGGWADHFVKGVTSLGLLGFVKTFLAMSTWQWWNLRMSGVLGGGTGRRGNTGRDRVQNVSLALVLIGVLTFFWWVWKGTHAWSLRTLDKASERILNVHKDNDEDEDDPDPNLGEESRKNQ